MAQVAEFERIMRATTAEALRLHDPDAERLFAYCLGSYCRGKPETGAPALLPSAPSPVASIAPRDSQ